MKLITALLAQQISERERGLIDVYGILATYTPPEVPFHYEQIHALFTVEASEIEGDEIGQYAKVEHILEHESGLTVFHIGANFFVPFAAEGQMVIHFNTGCQQNNIFFEQTGSYKWHILINGERLGHASFWVNEPDPNRYAFEE